MPSARRGGRGGQAEEAFDNSPFPQLRTFGLVAQVLEQVTQDEEGNSPVPRGQEKEDDACDHERNTNQVQGEVEGQQMSCAPLGPAFTDKAENGPVGSGWGSRRNFWRWSHGDNIGKQPSGVRGVRGAAGIVYPRRLEEVGRKVGRVFETHHGGVAWWVSKTRPTLQLGWGV